jgi:predicted GIY-YIG superfamily endonuclease
VAPSLVYGLFDRRHPETIRYVGVTTDLDHRLSAHRWHMSSTPLRRWVRVISPENLDVVVLHHVEDGEDRLALEREFIASTGADLNRKPNGPPGSCVAGRSVVPS